MEIESFFDRLWQDFKTIAPAAASIRQKLEEEGESVVNDHVAFRTYDLSPVSLTDLERHLLRYGYERYERYDFPAKKLNAYGYLHPSGAQPRVFLSELRTAELSAEHRALVQRLVAQVTPAIADRPDILWAGRLWNPIDKATYLRLRQESEFAAWVAVFGFRANHFTVSVNELQRYPSITKVLDFVEAQGFLVNESGGRVKGSPEVLLEQGSTQADMCEVELADGPAQLPSSYYEFALRYADHDGRLYDGFVPTSADRIFESTDAEHRT